MFEIERAYLDIEAIEAGRWLPLGADFPGVEILASGLTAPAAKRLRETLERKAPRADRLGNGQLSEDARDRILKTVIAQKCVHDWRGLASGGKPLAFSVETLEGIMREPRARRIAAAIVNAIVDLENTTLADEAEIEGN
jgi:hypothetical protein